jgi:chaperone modulatory protein CbpM
MRRIQDVLKEINRSIDQSILEDFIARGWVRPVRDVEDYIFDEVDISRIYLICELRIDMKFEVDAVDVIISLMDQLYENKSRFNKIINVIENQPNDVRDKIIKTVLSDKR